LVMELHHYGNRLKMQLLLHHKSSQMQQITHLKLLKIFGINLFLKQIQEIKLYKVYLIQRQIKMIKHEINSSQLGKKQFKKLNKLLIDNILLFLILLKNLTTSFDGYIFLII
jgi:hypothetical protein